MLGDKNIIFTICVILILFVLFVIAEKTKMSFQQKTRFQPAGQIDINSPTTQKIYKPVITLHYTDWCPECIVFRQEWEKLKKNPMYDFYENNEDINPSYINVYPTITVLYGPRRHIYNGKMDAENITAWLETPKHD